MDSIADRIDNISEEMDNITNKIDKMIDKIDNISENMDMIIKLIDRMNESLDGKNRNGVTTFLNLGNMKSYQPSGYTPNMSYASGVFTPFLAETSNYDTPGFTEISDGVYETWYSLSLSEREVKPEPEKTLERILEMIPEEEYDFIDSPEDIILDISDNLKLIVFEEISKRKQLLD